MLLSNRLILCHPLLLLPSIFPSISLSNESELCIRWPEYSSEYSWLVSFSIDWFDLIAAQGTLTSLLYHSLKASILQYSAFSMDQLSDLCMTPGKTTALTIQIFVGKVMSLLFNILSKFDITLLSKGKCLLISRLHSPSAVILEPNKIKSALTSTFSPSICQEVMGPDAVILVFLNVQF